MSSPDKPNQPIVQLVINEDFKTQLITALLSVPIVYVPSAHYNYVDMALRQVMPRDGELTGGNRNVTGLCWDTAVYDYDLYRRRVDFGTARSLPRGEEGVPIKDVLKNLVNRDKDSPAGEHETARVYLFKNLSQLLLDVEMQALLQTFALKYERKMFDTRTTIIIVSPMPVTQLPVELVDAVTILPIPQPTYAEIEQCVSQIKMSAQFELGKDTLVPDLCRTLQGLGFYDIQQILRSVLVRTGGRLTQNTKVFALDEKKRIVRKSGVIEVIDSDVGLDDIGGLEALKDDMRHKAVVYRHLSMATDARLPLPKGILIVGMPGCGKSMIAKAIANEFGVSLLRLDINNLLGMYVGQSEENLRKALATAEAAHPCVLWIDEIEKAFHGASNQGNNGDNTVVRMMGSFLTWMQERRTAVFIVATANDVMRPEFMRKGRFDEVYFVDFPNRNERKAIYTVKLRNYHCDERQPTIFDMTDALAAVDELAAQSLPETHVKGHDDAGFSGSEIDSAVNAVIEQKFVQYAQALDRKQDVKLPIKVTKDDLLKVIAGMRQHVMSGQVAGTKGNGRQDRTTMDTAATQIENIYRMNEIYKFKPASSH